MTSDTSRHLIPVEDLCFQSDSIYSVSEPGYSADVSHLIKESSDTTASHLGMRCCEKPSSLICILIVAGMKYGGLPAPPPTVCLIKHFFLLFVVNTAGWSCRWGRVRASGGQQSIQLPHCSANQLHSGLAPFTSAPLRGRGRGVMGTKDRQSQGTKTWTVYLVSEMKLPDRGRYVVF